VRLFESAASALEADAGGPVHLVRLIGPRTSFVAGRVPDEMPFVASVRVILNEQWALLFYPAPGHSIDREKVKAMFKDLYTLS
jgi:hypothetical protein